MVILWKKFRWGKVSIERTRYTQNEIRQTKRPLQHDNTITNIPTTKKQILRQKKSRDVEIPHSGKRIQQRNQRKTKQPTTW